MTGSPPLAAAPVSSETADQHPAAITKPMLDAVEGCKVVLMLRIDHLALECTLIHHYLDKIRRQLRG